MRKVTLTTCSAFLHGQNCAVGNTAAAYDRLLLHGNVIAIRKADGSIDMTLAGWNTPTTRERLNGLLTLMGYKNGRNGFTQRDFGAYYNGEEISPHDWINVKPPHDCGNIARVTCGSCNRSWCENCDPAPSALCHWCHGRGHSTAQVAD